MSFNTPGSVSIVVTLSKEVLSALDGCGEVHAVLTLSATQTQASTEAVPADAVGAKKRASSPAAVRNTVSLLDAFMARGISVSMRWREGPGFSEFEARSDGVCSREPDIGTALRVLAKLLQSANEWPIPLDPDSVDAGPSVDRAVETFSALCNLLSMHEYVHLHPKDGRIYYAANSLAAAAKPDDAPHADTVAAALSELNALNHQF